MPMIGLPVAKVCASAQSAPHRLERKTSEQRRPIASERFTPVISSAARLNEVTSHCLSNVKHHLRCSPRSPPLASRYRFFYSLFRSQGVFTRDYFTGSLGTGPFAYNQFHGAQPAGGTQINKIEKNKRSRRDKNIRKFNSRILNG